MGDKKQTNFSVRDQLRHTKEVKGQSFFEEKHMDQEKGMTSLQKFNMQFFSDGEDGKKLTRLQKGILAGLGVVAIGIMCTFIGPQLNSNKDIATTEYSTQASTTAKSNDETQIVETNAKVKNGKNEYGTQIEKELEEILKQVEGAGNVDVMLTLAETGEVVLAKENNQTREKTEEKDSGNGTRLIDKESTQDKIVMVDGNTPYVIKEKMPKISGVMILIEGGDNSELRYEIMKSVSALLDIPESKVNVHKMGKN